MTNVTHVNLKGFEEFDNYMNDLPANSPPIFLYFSGSKLPDGNSWCPDCVEAEPVVRDFIRDIGRPITFVYVDVGERDYWKDINCPFRTDHRTKLMVIPTIIRWKGVQRLEGSQCKDLELLQMICEEEE